MIEIKQKKNNDVRSRNFIFENFSTASTNVYVFQLLYGRIPLLMCCIHENDTSIYESSNVW